MKLGLIADTHDNLDRIVYGRTHQLDIRSEGHTQIINPCEAGGWLTGRASAVIVDLGSMTTETAELS